MKKRDAASAKLKLNLETVCGLEADPSGSTRQSDQCASVAYPSRCAACGGTTGAGSIAI